MIIPKQLLHHQRLFYLLAVAWLSLLLSSHGQDLVEARDLGQLRVNSENIIEFPLQNPSAKQLHVAYVRPSCSCLKVRHYPRTLAPGEEQDLSLLFVPHRAGPVAYEVIVGFANAAKKPLTYKVTARVLPPSKATTTPLGLNDAKPFLLAPEMLLTRLADQAAPSSQALLIDLRPADLFRSGRIVGALHVPASQFTLREEWLHRDLILFDGGLITSGTIKKAQALSQRSQASVHILNTSLPAWKKLGGATSSLTREAAYKLRAVDTYLASELDQRHDWYIIAMGERQQRWDNAFLTADFYAGNDTTTILKNLQTQLRTKAKDKKILLVSLLGELYRPVIKQLGHLTKVPTANIYYLKGGLNAWENQPTFTLPDKAGPKVLLENATHHTVSKKQYTQRRLSAGCNTCP